MIPLYLVDAETRTDKGKIVSDFHLETPSQGEAEGVFLRCWFRGNFWNVSIRKSFKEEMG